MSHTGYPEKGTHPGKKLGQSVQAADPGPLLEEGTHLTQRFKPPKIEQPLGTLFEADLVVGLNLLLFPLKGVLIAHSNLLLVPLSKGPCRAGESKSKVWMPQRL